MRSDTPAGASLDNDQVLSQDAYGARTEVTIGGATVPVADLAVGRLVKTSEEIESDPSTTSWDCRVAPCRSTTSTVTARATAPPW